MISAEDIRAVFRGTLSVNEPMAKYTSMKIGGPADFFMEPADKQDLAAAVRYLTERGVPWIVIGRGSNLLVSDDGIRGVVLNLEAGEAGITLDQGIVTAEAGIRLTKFVDFCIQHGLAGVENLAGIPGTLGGAIVMNAGAYGSEISQHLIDVEVLRNGMVMRVSKHDGGFTYRNSGFWNDVVLGASFKLPAGEKEMLAARRRELIMKRNQSQPLELPNAGSMFKNPPNNFAAQLIEQVGLKGKQVGNAQISAKHANFIVNLGGAKAVDVITLLELARRTVYQNAGIMLEMEVQLVGFSDDVKARVA